ncbi:DUF6011 domain-containing protein [Streptosporangium roseum]|uniref:DUF6011 domain-containing protein n=1 Tax=Streptosporangium roseum TaxID=2001 RepID=UPI003329903A
MTLFAEEPDPPSEPRAARCRCCRRLLTADDSLGYRIGRKCREKLGITSRKAVRPARVRSGGDVPGQTNLMEEASE